ncbi:MAG: UbiA prenyltransferase family protein [Phycisphaerales bacterium]
METRLADTVEDEGAQLTRGWSNELLKLRDVLRLARIEDWTKNLFVVPPLLSSGRALDPESQWACLLAFIAFAFVSSGVYCVNDAIDWREDRKHPVKRRRPIASGALSPSSGYALGAIWIAAGFGVSFFTGGPGVAATLAAYLVLQTFYNLILKRIAIVDVVTLSLGFVLRALAGAVAIGVDPSLWLLLSVFFLCLFLGQIKRLCDLMSVRKNQDGHEWKAAAGYQSADELNWMLGVSASLAIVTFVMYSLSEHAALEVGAEVRGFILLTPLVVIVMFRIYRVALRGLSDSPLHILLTDPIILASSVAFGVAAALVLYVPFVGERLRTLFET